MSDNDSEESAVTVRDKVEKYLNTHKKPVTIKAMSERFMVSPRTIRKALAGIRGLVVVIVGQTHWYRRKT